MMKKKQYTSVTFIKALLLTIVLGLLAYVIDVPAIRISLIGMPLASLKKIKSKKPSLYRVKVFLFLTKM